MNLFRKVLLGVLLSIALPPAADAACGSLPYSFTNNVSIVDATATNANNNFLLGCVTAVDATQIGPSGIFASQVIPNAIGTATFGGAFGYRFSLSSPSQPVLSIFGATAQSGDLFDIYSVGGATKFMWVDSGGTLRGNNTVFLSVSTASAAFGLNSTTANVVTNPAATSGWAWTNAAGTLNNLVWTDPGNMTIRGTLAAGGNITNTVGYMASTAGFLAGGWTAPTSVVPLAVGSTNPNANAITAFSATGTLTFQNNAGTGFMPLNGGAYTNSSDRRLKRAIHSSPYGLAAILKLRPSAYTLRASGKKSVGLIAQDVRAVIPEAVNVMDKKTGYLGIESDALVSTLIGAVQQQQGEINELKRRLAIKK